LSDPEAANVDSVIESPRSSWSRYRWRIAWILIPLLSGIIISTLLWTNRLDSPLQSVSTATRINLPELKGIGFVVGIAVSVLILATVQLAARAGMRLPSFFSRFFQPQLRVRNKPRSAFPPTHQASPTLTQSLLTPENSSSLLSITTETSSLSVSRPAPRPALVSTIPVTPTDALTILLSYQMQYHALLQRAYLITKHNNTHFYRHGRELSVFTNLLISQRLDTRAKEYSEDTTSAQWTHIKLQVEKEVHALSIARKTHVIHFDDLIRAAKMSNLELRRMLQQEFALSQNNTAVNTLIPLFQQIINELTPPRQSKGLMPTDEERYQKRQREEVRIHKRFEIEALIDESRELKEEIQRERKEWREERKRIMDNLQKQVASFQEHANHQSAAATGATGASSQAMPERKHKRSSSYPYLKSF